MPEPEPPAAHPPEQPAPPPQPPIDQPAPEKPAAPAGKSYEDVVYPQRKQSANRAENQDFVRVMNMFGGALPQVYYIGNISVASDMYMGTGSQPGASVYSPSTRDLTEVTSNEIHKIIQVYERHASYMQALDILRKHRAVVLRGRLQVGKRAAAIHLATEFDPSRPPDQEAIIRELSAEDDLLQQIKSSEAKAGVIYLVDGLLSESGRALTSRAARQALDHLAQRNAALIICVQPHVPMPIELRQVIVEPLKTPTARLVEKHLEYYGPFDEETVQCALQDEKIAKVLEQGLAPFQADQLSYQLAETLKAGEKPENALVGLAAAIENEVRKWLDETADAVQESAFRISLAVFSGSGYKAIDDAARQLAPRLLPAPPPLPKNSEAQPPPTPESPLKKQRITERLNQAHARRVMRNTHTEYSANAVVEVIELEDPSYSVALLKYIWTEIGEWQQPILDWLCEYAVNYRQPVEIRQRAAGALGALAGLDFYAMRERVFKAWAYTSADDPDERRSHYQALGNALGILVWNDERKENVLGLLDAWVDTGKQSLKWAAARAYASVGLRFPKTAVQQWRVILESEARINLRLTDDLGISIPHPLHNSVLDALISLFLKAVELPHRLRPVYEEAMEGIADWVEADAKERDSQQYGLPIFLLLTAIRRPPEDGNSDPESWPPAMLYLVGDKSDPGFCKTLAGLLRRALNHHAYGPLAIVALEMWMESVEKDSSLHDPLKDLLQEMLNQPSKNPQRERDRLWMWLNRWATRPKAKNPLLVAGDLINKLELKPPKPSF